MNGNKFKPRINITFRSTYNIDNNPLLNMMCVANHNRYYRIPSSIYYSDGDRNLEKVCDAYSSYNIKIHKRVLNKNKWKQKYTLLCDTYGFDKCKYKNNMVQEFLIDLCNYIELK